MTPTRKTAVVTLRRDVVLDALDSILAGFHALRNEVAALEDGAPVRLPDLLEPVVDLGGRLGTLSRREPPAKSPPPATEVEDPKKLLGGLLGLSAFSPMVRKILVVLAQHPAGLRKSQVLLHAGYSQNGATSESFATIVREGWAVAPLPGTLKITDAGRTALGPFEKLPTGDRLRASLLGDANSKLSPMDKAILFAVCDAFPRDASKGDVLRAADYSQNGATSESFARLVRLGYVKSAGPGRLVASKELFG